MPPDRPGGRTMGENAPAASPRTASAPVPGPGRLPSSRAGYAALGWAVAYGGFGLVAASAGIALFHRATEPLPVALNWIVVAVAARSYLVRTRPVCTITGAGTSS
ncbi:hypothetical protein ACLQ2R_29965 [Streptosporangium sp. DT93]|uniref:hypothetical protein n=1 Tax=Streptosporangium sp. DT93 TaxID=3393428 RepID=UPI003CEE1D07